MFGRDMRHSVDVCDELKLLFLEAKIVGVTLAK